MKRPIEEDQDYRADFYPLYHRAVGLRGVPSSVELERSVRQFRGRWDHRLPADRSVTCVDLGCGTGEFLYYLRQRGFNDVRGVDLNSEELAVARQLGIVSVFEQDAASYLASLPEASLGMVSAHNFFEHLKKAEVMRLLPLVHRALKPGGIMIAVTPNGLSPFSGTTRYWDFSHETGFTPASWRQLARMFDFEAAEFEEYGPLLHSVGGALRTAAWGAVRLGLLAVSYVEVGGPRDPSAVFTADMKIILKRGAN